MKESSRNLAVVLLGVVGVTALGVGAWLYLDRVESRQRTGAASRSGAEAAEGSPVPHPLPATPEDLDRVRRLISVDGIIATALDRYRLRSGRYPAALSALSERPADWPADKRWDGPYLHTPRLLQDPWQHPLEYRFPGVKNSSYYDLWSVGPDGVSGTDDDIGNW
jgi:type II secretion system protein G